MLQGKSRWKTVAVGAAVAVVAVLGWLVYRHGRDAAMLRLAPDSLPENASLYAFAVSGGKGVFARNCAGCHGADMKGDRKTGVPDLTDVDWQFGEGRVAEIEQIALYGIRAADHRTKNQADMPAFGREQPYARYSIPTLTPQEMDDIATYIGVTQGREAEPEALKRGIALFDTKGQCFDCHGNDMGGDTFIGAPNLADKVWVNGDGSKKAIIDIIAQGRVGVSPMFKNTLSPAQIRAVAAYIHSKAIPPPPAA